MCFRLVFYFLFVFLWFEVEFFWYIDFLASVSLFSLPSPLTLEGAKGELALVNFPFMDCNLQNIFSILYSSFYVIVLSFTLRRACFDLVVGY